MPKPHKDGPPQKATVPLWVVSMPGVWTLVAAANKEQAEWVGYGWAGRRGQQASWWRVRVKRARAADVARAREWASQGDEDAAAMLRLTRLAADDNPEPEPPLEDQLTLI